MLGVPFNFAAKAPTPTAMLTFPLKPSVPTLMQCCSVLCLAETTLKGLFPIQTGILFSTFVYFVKGVMHIYIREHTWRSENHFHHVASIVKLGDSCLLARSPYQPPQTEILFFLTSQTVSLFILKEFSFQATTSSQVQENLGRGESSEPLFLPQLAIHN